MLFSNLINKIVSDKTEQPKIDKINDDVKNISGALSALLYDSSSINNKDKIINFSEQLKTATDKLNNFNNDLIKIQLKTTNDIENTATSIKNYRETLKNNNNLFQKYSQDIQNKMQLVATRDRMLQLSQERNVYKKKVIYILFSIIITLLIIVVSIYTFFGKAQINKI